MLLRISLGFPLMHAQNLTRTKRIQPSLNKNGNIKALLVPLGGLLNQHAPTLHHLIPSCQPTVTNCPEVISMWLFTFTSSIASIQQSIMDSHSRWRRNPRFTPTWRFPTRLIRKHTTTHYLPVLNSTTAWQRTAMLAVAGAPKSVMPLARASNCLSSNFAAWVVPSFSVPAALLCGKWNYRTALCWACVTLKSALQTWTLASLST